MAKVVIFSMSDIADLCLSPAFSKNGKTQSKKSNPFHFNVFLVYYYYNYSGKKGAS
jgi:hypothetical protein